MKLKHIAIATALHFITLIVFAFLGLGATMGLGFKDELTVFDEIFKVVTLYGLKILAGWAWAFHAQLFAMHSAIQWLVIFLNSLCQGVLFLILYFKLRQKK